MLRYTSAVILAALLLAGASAQPPEPLPLPLPAPKPKPKAIPQPTPEESAALAKTLRDVMLTNMPSPLATTDQGWGKQKEFVVGAVMLRDPKKFGPDAPRKMANDGLWQRFTVQAVEPSKSLNLAIADFTRPVANTANIVLNAEMDVKFRVEHQYWKRGLLLYTGETRGHCKAGLKLKAEIVSKSVMKPGAFLPDINLCIKVTEANLFHDKITIDHTIGLDGNDAKAVGDFVLDLVKVIKPELEKQLLDKANAGIMKAANSKEITVQLDKLVVPAAGKK